MSLILAIIDGMTDEQTLLLDGLTPFEYGIGDGFRELMDNHAFGEMNTTPEGFDVDSMNCIMTILGAKPEEIPEGRSYIETLALGIPTEKNDYIMRCNLVAIDGIGTLISSCGGGLSGTVMEEISAKLEALSTDSLKLHHMSTYKNILVLKNGLDRGRDIKMSPPHQLFGKHIDELTPNFVEIKDLFGKAQEIFRAYTTENEHYALLVWGGCYQQEVPRFEDIYGIKGGAVCKTEIVRGIALAMGLDTPELITATADVDTDTALKLEKTLELAEKYPFVLIHINGTDEASHRKRPREKADFIGKVDKEIINPLLKSKHKLIVCTDHTTSSQTGVHMGGLQPVFVKHMNGYLGKIEISDLIKAEKEG